MIKWYFTDVDRSWLNKGYHAGPLLDVQLFLSWAECSSTTELQLPHQPKGEQPHRWATVLDPLHHSALWRTAFRLPNPHPTIPLVSWNPCTQFLIQLWEPREKKRWTKILQEWHWVLPSAGQQNTQPPHFLTSWMPTKSTRENALTSFEL